jgi:hypothetical protein
MSKTKRVTINGVNSDREFHVWRSSCGANDHELVQILWKHDARLRQVLAENVMFTLEWNTGGDEVSVTVTAKDGSAENFRLAFPVL